MINMEKIKPLERIYGQIALTRDKILFELDERE